MTRTASILATALTLIVPPTRGAQAQQEAGVPRPPPAPPFASESAPPPYQERLEHLAELMGTLAFMRNLCGDGDGAAWRGRMASLLSAEGTTPARRERLAGRFNRGYAGYALTYRTCTPAAESVIARALSEGAEIAADIAARFGTP